MDNGELLVEVRRGGRIESVHTGHAVVCTGSGEIVESWGAPETVIFPRSSCKMIQALPLVESGAAEEYSLSPKELALACASHRGASIHTDAVQSWLLRIARADDDLRCGPQMPRDPEAQHETIREDLPVCQYHNNCSGKHTGFLTLSRHLGAGPEYIDPDHPVQRAVRAAFEDVTGEDSPGFGIDGCSAPNFATSLHGLARGIAGFATAEDTTVRGRAQRQLVAAMTAHPEMVDGEGGCCTGLMRAAGGRVVVKTGAEGVMIGILPKLGLGIALKIADGTARASECAIAALLVRLGVLDPHDPAARQWMMPQIRNRRNLIVGDIRPAPGLVPA